MTFDPILLSRIQFGFTIGFHILFPTLNVGLALFLAIMEGRWLQTGERIYLTIAQFWSKIFAITFGMGVVSGIVLSYELGTNYGPFIQKAGSVVGPLMIYEVLAAFFLEAGFLGIMLFGWNKVSPKRHYFATLMVMLGTFISAVAIMAVNSWMQTPAGFTEIGGQYVVDSWLKVIFTPSYLARTVHMVTASYLTTSFVIAGVSAWYLLQQRHLVFAKRCFQFSLGAALIISSLQIVLGDNLGLWMRRTQPLKTAAVEAVWDTQKGAPFLIFALPSDSLEKNHYAVGIPKVASLLNTHHLDGELVGLKSVKKADRPPVLIPFFMFRLMVGIGFLLFGISLYGLWLRRQGRLFETPWFHKVCVAASPLGFVSTIAGWMVTEVGRQPWVVYQWMRTGEGSSRLVTQQILTTLTLFFVVYTLVFIFYLYYLFNIIAKGPGLSPSNEATSEVLKEAPFKYLSPEGEK